MAKVFVTGATGLLGSTLTRRLIESGEDVRIYRRESSRMDLIGDFAGRVEHAVGDLNDRNVLREAMAGVDCVYHLAGHVAFRGRADRAQLMRVNVDGTGAVINAALENDVRRLVHTSSMAAFGRPERPDGILTEDSEWHRLRGNSVYAHSKYLSELEIHRGIAEGLDAVIVNPALLFGIGRQGENTQRIVDAVRTESLPAIPAGGTNVVDVLDVSEGMIRAMERGVTGERYFLGSENLSWVRIIHTLADAFGNRPPRYILSRPSAMALAYLSEGWSMITSSRPRITRENARSMSLFYHYSNRKAIEELGCTFRTFEATAERLARAPTE